MLGGAWTISMPSNKGNVSTSDTFSIRDVGSVNHRLDPDFRSRAEQG